MLIFGPTVLLTLVGFVIAYQFVEPAPPREITLATGSEGGAYHRFGQRYQDLLAADGITVHLQRTTGSVANLKLLENGETDAAFLQGGIGSYGENDGPIGLASLYFEPLWIFVRKDERATRLYEFGSKRLAVGEKGSGTRALATKLLASAGINEPSPDAKPTTWLDLDSEAAADALVNGGVDVVFLVGSPEIPVVQRLVRAADIRLFSLDRAPAYTRHHRYLSSIVLNEGVIDLSRNLPPADVQLLCATAGLIVKHDFHPALVGLLLEAASEIHREGGILEEPRQFPSPRYLGFPASDEARRFFRSGLPFLNRFMPFWAANLIDRLKVMLLPLLTLLIPFVKLVPPLYRWRLYSKKIYRWYRQMQDLERRARRTEDEVTRQGIVLELETIEMEVARITMPPSYADDLYHLRFHVSQLRERVQRQTEKQK